MSDPVTATLLLLLAFGLGAVFGLMSARSRETYPPAPTFYEPARHVAPVVIGTCAMCGKEGVRVHDIKPHPLLDPEPHCDGCARAEVEA